MGLTHSTSNNNRLVHSQYLFASRLYATLSASSLKTSSNLICSPISIYLALTMCLSGANGQTLSEMLSACCIQQPGDFKTWKEQELEPFVKQVMQHLNPQLLSIANKAFVKKETKLVASYEEHVKRAFGVEVQSCDFAGNAEGERQLINGWVADRTNQLIKELLTPDHVKPFTKMILVNAIHFLGGWKQEFDENYTAEDMFFHAEGHSMVSMMNMTGVKKQYGSAEGYHWLTLPYSDNQYTMTFVMPQRTGSDEAAKFDQWLSEKLTENYKFPSQETKLEEVKIPKFDIEQEIELKDVLQQAPFNMTTAFTTNADFSNMVQDDTVNIGDIVHKAVIKVNEKGTEAAAATAVVMRCLSVSHEVTFSFTATSPFAFVLTDEATHSILFIGKVNKL